MTDEELIAGMAGRQDAALSYVYRVFKPSLLTTMISWGASIEEAKDIFQEAMYAELRVRPTEDLDLHSATYKTYLRSICWRQYLKLCRKKKRAKPVTQGQPEVLALNAAVERQLEAADFKSVVDKGMQRLSEACRRLISQALIFKWASAKIGELLGIPEATARQRVHRCRNRLREFVGQDPMYREMTDK